MNKAILILLIAIGSSASAAPENSATRDVKKDVNWLLEAPSFFGVGEFVCGGIMFAWCSAGGL